LVMFSPHLNGFCHRQLRRHLAQLLGQPHIPRAE
jgi:hypothetical protein